MQASEAGYTESYIICPAAMVGPPTGPVPAGSVFFKFMTQVALAFKKAIYIGEGSNVFYTVSVPLEPVLSRTSFPWLILAPFVPSCVWTTSSISTGVSLRAY